MTNPKQPDKSLRKKISDLCLLCIPEDLRDNPYGKNMADVTANKILALLPMKEEVKGCDKTGVAQEIEEWCKPCPIKAKAERYGKALREIENNHFECDGGEACEAHKIAQQALKE